MAPQKPPPIIKDQDRGDESWFRGHHTASAWSPVWITLKTLKLEEDSIPVFVPRRIAAKIGTCRIVNIWYPTLSSKKFNSGSILHSWQLTASSSWDIRNANPQKPHFRFDWGCLVVQLETVGVGTKTTRASLSDNPKPETRQSSSKISSFPSKAVLFLYILAEKRPKTTRGLRQSQLVETHW